MATMPPEVIFFIKKVKTTTGKKMIGLWRNKRRITLFVTFENHHLSSFSLKLSCQMCQ